MSMIPARWHGGHRTHTPSVIFVHDMEAPEGATTAESVGRYFATTDRKASAHVGADTNSRCRYLPDDHVAWAAGAHANSVGLHLELAGYARQTRAEWLDTSTRLVLRQGAMQVAQWSSAHAIPVRHLTAAQLAAGERGIASHDDARRAWPRDTSHTDPGPDFPWSIFLELVRSFLTPDVRVHVVRDGESLWSIAADYYHAGAQWPRLEAANHLRSTVLHPGQKLVIP